MSGFDFIGDVHGCCRELEALLRKMGYVNVGTDDDPVYAHPTRKAVFLGDYIDRGSKILRTLKIIKAMVDHKKAYALMGNHEYNAILYHTYDKTGRPLREHTPKNNLIHQRTLEEIDFSSKEGKKWIQWFKSLSPWLDLKDESGNTVCAVHACFDKKAMIELQTMRFNDKPLFSFVDSMPTLTESGFAATSQKGTRAYELLEIILKGPEVKVPDGGFIRDKEGIERKEFRLRWWTKKETYGEMALIPSLKEKMPWMDKPFDLKNRDVIRLSSPTFFGHYWMNPDSQAVFSPFAACLDSSCVFSGVLTAYRFNDGERFLTSKNLVRVSFQNEMCD